MRVKSGGRRRPPGERQQLRMADEAAAASSLQAAAALASLHLPQPGPTATDRQDRRYFGRGARIKLKAKRKWGFDTGREGSAGLPPRHLGHRRSTRGGVGSMNEVLKGEVGIRSRFSALRIRQIMRDLTPKQQGYVAKYGFEHFNRIGEFNVHEPLTEWIMGKINPPFSEFRIDADKTIVFSKSLVQKVLGVPSGTRPVVLHGQKTDKINELRALYLNDGLRASIPHAVCLLKNNEDEESFMRTFLLIALAAVLTPTTGNTIDLDYLWLLEDMSKVQDLDWAGHITEHLMDEVQKFQYKAREEKMTNFWVGGCLPLLMIAYMDHLDLPRGRIVDRVINYSLPRICHVSKHDFQFAAIADLHRQHYKFATFGILPFRDRTPYTDNPITGTEVPEDDLHIQSNSNSKDQVLPGQWELIEVHEERIDELDQEIQPEILGFAEPSIDHSSFGRTNGCSEQGTTKSASCKMGSSSNCRNTTKAALTPSSSDKSEEDSARECEFSESADHPTPPETDYGVIFRSFLYGAQMEKVNMLIQEIQPKTIVFVATMRKCDVQLPSPLLIISKERALAAAAHFPHENGTVTLQMMGKSEKWRPRFFIEKDTCMLAGNWLDFVCDNQVQAGDICIFVPAKGGERSTFMVHIIRAEVTHPRGVKRVRSSHDSPVDGEGMANPDVV